jgi:hypothetical protein
MLDIIAAFFISALMGMGIGGGGLFVIYLTMWLNYEQIIAQGTNLVFFVLAGLASLFIHLRKRKIKLSQLFPMMIFGTAGALITSCVANLINPKIPRMVLGVLLSLSGILTLIKTFKDMRKEKSKKIEKTLYK